MKFQKGKPRTGGRQPGTPNALTGAFRDAVRHVYAGLGGHANFLVWAKANETEFYRIASRLIPGEMQEGNGAGNITVIVQRVPETRTPEHEGNRTVLIPVTSLSAESPSAPTPESLLPLVQSKNL
jgi:hypothetical protein